ncbi:hypothetical protein [Dactylosporangium maewongense]
MPRRSTWARVIMAILALPLLLGCLNCCDAIPSSVDDVLPEKGRPQFTQDQVAGVWTSECGGKVSIRDDGTYHAEGLVLDDDGDVPPLTGDGSWSIVAKDEHNDQRIFLNFGEHSAVQLRAERADRFEHLEIQVDDAQDAHDCRMNR